MKEKLILFAPVCCCLTSEQMETVTEKFMLRYPHLRLVRDCETIDYNIQFVKVIIVTAIKAKFTDAIHINFTNTSGKIYESMLFNPKSNN